MLSPIAAKAIDEALKHGRAILKFISANDAGLTKSHQSGFYLPKGAWRLYSPFPPEKHETGKPPKSSARIFWQGDFYTDSVVTWYGKKTRSQGYRLA